MRSMYINNQLVSSLVIPDEVEVIKPYAFRGWNLQSIYIGDGVTKIGNYAFDDCGYLSYVRLGNACDTIGAHAFDDCSIDWLGVRSSPSYLGCDMHCQNVVVENLASWFSIDFSSYKITGGYTTTSTIYDVDMYVGDELLTDLVIPDEVTRINSNAFYAINLRSVSIHNNVEFIGNYAFNCAGDTINVNYNAENCTIGNGGAFWHVDSMMIGPDVQNIPSGMVRCAKTLIFDASTTSIGDNVFIGCGFYPSRLVMLGPPPSASSLTFDEATGILSIVVPCTYLEQYQTATGWNQFAPYRYVSVSRTVSLEGNGYYQGGHAEVDQPDCYSTAVVTAYPNSCWHFVRWSDGSTENPRTLTPNYNMTIRPYFAQLPYNVWIVYDTVEFYTWSDLGYVDVEKNGCDSTVVLTAYTNDYGYYGCGYQFSHWHDGSTENPRTIRLTSDTVFMPVFVRYEVHAYSSDYDQGYVSTSCDGSAATIIAYPECSYQFSHWSDGSTENPRTIHLTGDTTLVAYFEQSQVGYWVTVLPSDSTLGWTVGSRRYSDCYHDRTESGGFEAEMYAIPFGGSVFNGWSNGSMSNPLTIIATSDTLVTAHFSAHAATDSVYVHDTVTLTVHDTTVITLRDTIISTVTLIDTVTLHSTDTLYITNTDTLTITQTDTLWMTRVDTLWLHDTVYIRDTIYIHDTVYVGVDDVETVDVKLYQRGGQIVVEGAEGNTVTLYDVSGRVLATKQDDYAPLHFDAPASGAYMIRVGRHPARKIVVVK